MIQYTILFNVLAAEIAFGYDFILNYSIPKYLFHVVL